MTQIAVQAQIDAIQKAQQKAVKSKDAALKFLKDAGIIQSTKSISKTKSPTKK